MRHAVTALALALALAACSSTPPPVAPCGNAAAADDGGGAPATTAQLAADLEAALDRMPYWPAHDETVAAFWARPGNPGALEAVLDDRAAPGKARFVAAEILFEKDPRFAERHDRGALARLYAEALVGRSTQHANAWGLLEADSRPGEVGAHLLAIGGEETIAALRPLLDDATTVSWYAGSEEATVGNGYRYRIKDFAAWYIARLSGYPLPHHDMPGPRDAEIDKLKAALAAEIPARQW